MYILDKNQDYYDYYSHIYGTDKSITFDRRGSNIISDINIVGSEKCFHTDWENHSLYGYRVLEVGNIQYIIKLTNVKFLTDYKKQIYSIYQSSNFEIVQIFKENKHRYKDIMSIHGIDFDYDWKHNKYNYSQYPKELERFQAVSLPILANTQITKLIDPFDIWKELSNYISSLKNDKDTYSAPDIEKVVNHGFDKKSSFRNIK